MLWCMLVRSLLLIGFGAFLGAGHTLAWIVAVELSAVLAVME